MDKQAPTLAAYLAKAAAEVNARGNGSPGPFYNPQNYIQEAPPVGKECAQRLRDAAEKTALAIEAQAEERLQAALSVVEECKALQAKAKSIADDVRRQGEEGAQRAIDFATKLEHSAQMMAAIAEKFANDELLAGAS